LKIPAEELAEDGLDQTIEKTVDIANYLPYWAKDRPGQRRRRTDRYKDPGREIRN